MARCPHHPNEEMEEVLTPYEGGVLIEQRCPKVYPVRGGHCGYVRVVGQQVDETCGVEEIPETFHASAAREVMMRRFSAAPSFELCGRCGERSGPGLPCECPKVVPTSYASEAREQAEHIRAILGVED